MFDVAIAGGGPAGLAAAIRAAQGGLKAVVLERSAESPDKACGEGLMPSGLRELEKLGALGRVAPGEKMEFRGIRYLQENGCSVEACFRHGNGLGIRRTALSRALRERARECGAEIRRATVSGAQARDGFAEVRTDGGALQARLVIAADGLHSPLRRAAGLDLESALPPRFGLRRHFALRPWSDLVEVHWGERVEAYVTPVGPEHVNVAFLFQGKESGFEALLGRFPALQERLAGARAETESRGAGPLLQRVRARHGERLALLGDAAGYVDAITGQGLSLAFAASALLFDALPGDLSRDLAPALRRYDRSLRASYLRYAAPARALVALSQRPRLRREAIGAVARIPGAFGALVSLVG